MPIKIQELEMGLMVLTLLVGIALGAVAGAVVMRSVVIMEARLAGCEVQP